MQPQLSTTSKPFACRVKTSEPVHLKHDVDIDIVDITLICAINTGISERNGSILLNDITENIKQKDLYGIIQPFLK